MLTAAGASLLTGGAGLVGSAVNAITTSIQNRKAREFAQGMYDQQRRDSLADWNMQNQYNSPEAQMERYKDAGLNPNLIYGQQTTTPAVRSSSPGSWKPENPNIGTGFANAGGSAVDTYFTVAQKKQTLSNMEAQNRLLDLSAIKMAAEIQSLQAGTASTLQKTSFGSKLFDTTQATMLAKLEQIRSQTGLQEWRKDSIIEDVRFKQDTAKDRVDFFRANLAQKLNTLDIQETQKTQALVQLSNMKKTGQLMDFELQLNKQGLTKGDPAWSRALANMLQKAGLDVSGAIAEKIASWLR